MFKSALTIVQKQFDSSRQMFQSKIMSAIGLTQRWYAKQWWRIHGRYDYLSILKTRHGYSVIVIFIMLLIVTSSILSPSLQRVIEPYFLTPESIASLRTLLITVGAALVGASAIAFTLVMFAMQVNVERMPHGLFRKFSSDFKLLSAFGITFLLAIVICVLSLIPDKYWVAWAVLISFWGTVLILVFFVYGYRRALRLISPTEQLAIIIADARRDFKVHIRRAERARPLLRPFTTEGFGFKTGIRIDSRLISLRLLPTYAAMGECRKKGDSLRNVLCTPICRTRGPRSLSKCLEGSCRNQCRLRRGEGKNFFRKRNNDR